MTTETTKRDETSVKRLGDAPAGAFERTRPVGRPAVPTPTTIEE